MSGVESRGIKLRPTAKRDLEGLSPDTRMYKLGNLTCCKQVKGEKLKITWGTTVKV